MNSKSVPKARHLGRGLESLLGPTTNIHNIGNEDPNTTSILPKKESIHVHSNNLSIEDILLDSISLNPYQTRTYFNESQLEELTQSIQSNGIVQPIIVRRKESGYELIAGERRLRAFKKLEKDTIPAIIRSASDEQMCELALIENIHRAGLNPIERAKAYELYIDRFNLSQTEAAKRLGEDRSVLTNHLRLLELPNELQNMLIDGHLSMGHARAILSLPSNEERISLANRAKNDQLSVRDVEKAVKTKNFQNNRISTKSSHKLPHIIELEDKLSHYIGSRVKINTYSNGKKGKLFIEFNSPEEFDQLLDKMGISMNDDF